MNESSFKGFNAPFVAENIIFLDEIGSTNDYAKDLGKNGTSSGTAVITAKQSAGKGRLGRIWDGGEAKDIYLSLLLRPKGDSSRLTLMAGVCVANTLNRFLTDLDEKAMIKWPNDVVVGGRKICGILTERGEYGVVVGIGINIGRESFPEELLDKATSLNIATGQKHDRAEIIKFLLTNLSLYYESFENSGVSSFIEEYGSLCVNIGKTVAIHENNVVYTAAATGISPDGKLEITLENGTKRVLDSGEVSVRGIYGYV
ncbi:MAG: biotin--[acetyl-CoA-carboxylase] ligase [Defluviitaleaceae bacterium]|nr:biotin--[acetyl-CoA-carboxylase] ligase [Defluviitaleaceae bacterium]